jgi:alcohol dehydrogenase
MIPVIHSRLFDMVQKAALIAAFTAAALAALSHVLPATFEQRPCKPHATRTMACVRYHEHGAASVLRHERCARPAIAPHQILVAVRYAALNPCDFKFRRNPAPSFVVPKPKIPGADLAGVVVEVGGQVAGFAVGDKVAAMLPLLGTPWGAMAQFAPVSAAHAARVPAGVSLQHAAAVPLVSLTVLQALEHLWQPAGGGLAHLRGKRLLVQAGGGGVGSFALQWASAVLGMSVSTTARAANAARLRALGADVVDYSAEPFERAAALQGVDVVLDPMSFLYEARTLASGVLRAGGHYLNILGSDWALSSTGAEVGNGVTTWWNFGCAKARQLGCAVLGALGQAGGGCSGAVKYSVVAVSPDGGALGEVLAKLAAGEIKAIIDRTLPLAQAQEAFLYLEEGHAHGKVLLEMPDADADA